MRDINKEVENVVASIMYKHQFFESLYKLETGFSQFTPESLAIYFDVNCSDIETFKKLVLKLSENLNKRED